MKLRKRFGVFLICAVLAVQIVGCGNSDNSQNNRVQSGSPEIKSEQGGIGGNSDEPAQPTENAETENIEKDTDGNQILIAYFTAGENSDVDAEVVTDGFTVSEREVAEAAGDVTDWLRGLGY